MKTLLLATTLLVNPLNTVTTQENQNQYITTITYNDTERTNVANNYNYIDLQQEYNIVATQKYGTTTQTTNNIANVQAYNYCGISYFQDVEESTTMNFITHTFFIYQFTPYNHISNSTINIQLNMNVNMFETETFNSYSNDLAFTIATTQTDLSTMLNVSNWTNFNNTLATGYWAQAYTNNLNKTTLVTQERTPVYYNLQEIDYPIQLNNVLIESQKITYIIGQIDYFQNADGDTQSENIMPNQNTQLMHVDQMIITSTKQAVTYTQEIVDIPGLMFTILGLPFSFISQAFDLTIFPGTPYQVNFSNIFLGFIAIAMLLWVLKLILGQADIGQWLGDQKRMHREERLRDKSHKQAMKRNEQYNKNRHEELSQKERLAHERATKHKGNR